MEKSQAGAREPDRVSGAAPTAKKRTGALLTTAGFYINLPFPGSNEELGKK